MGCVQFSKAIVKPSVTVTHRCFFLLQMQCW